MLTDRVLIADDDPVFLRSLEGTLREWGYRVMAATSAQQAWDYFSQRGTLQLMILDWVMPETDGVELIRRIRAHENGEHAYIIMLTVNDDPEALAHGFQAGADDYLTKPFAPIELRARLRAGQRILGLLSRWMERADSWRLKATRDPLTGLLNRSGILEILQRELARAERQHMPLSVLMIDLDRFKAVNDTFGHLSGDSLLTQVANVLRRGVRIYDGLGRYGGDEFLLVLSDCSADEAREVAERARKAVEHSPLQLPQGAARTTASVGIIALGRVRDVRAVDVLQAADDAMRQAKRAGGNRIVLRIDLNGRNAQSADPFPRVSA